MGYRRGASAAYRVDEHGDEYGAGNLGAKLGARVIQAARHLLMLVLEEGADDGQDDDGKGGDDDAGGRGSRLARLAVEEVVGAEARLGLPRPCLHSTEEGLHGYGVCVCGGLACASSRRVDEGPNGRQTGCCVVF
jgi:hypothetical protein